MRTLLGTAEKIEYPLTVNGASIDSDHFLNASAESRRAAAAGGYVIFVRSTDPEVFLFSPRLGNKATAEVFDASQRTWRRYPKRSYGDTSA